MTLLTSKPHAEIEAAITSASAERLVVEEASCLDEGRWDDWLNLFTEDAKFWVPSWDDYHTPTSDPDTQLSLIYYASRKRLEERVWRLRSGQSPASVPLHRAIHSVTNFRMDPNDETAINSNFVVHSFNPARKEVLINFGRYRHTLKVRDGVLRIAAKTIWLQNDYLPASVDIYTI